jgi:hypothetical protein
LCIKLSNTVNNKSLNGQADGLIDSKRDIISRSTNYTAKELLQTSIARI